MDGQDFTEDYSGGGFHEGQNGGAAREYTASSGNPGGHHGHGGGGDSGSADVPGKDDDRKLFVGGLSWETTEKELREHFGQYGGIESVNVKTDPTTGRSRGFAFLVFDSPETIEKILEASSHVINGKQVDPKKAKARTGKIFVGGLKTELSDDDIKNHFGQYGVITEVEMPFDKVRNLRKGFCFITFEQETVVNDILRNPRQSINGVEVDIKKATPKPADGMMMMRGGMRGGRGDMRGVRGAGIRGGRGGRGGFGSPGGYGQGGYGGYGQGGYGGYGGYGDSAGGYDYSGYGGYGAGGYGGYDYGSYGTGGGYGGYNSYGTGGGSSYGSQGYSGGGGGKTQRGGATRQPARHQPY